jgi:AraC-like DNA-binding protein
MDKLINEIRSIVKINKSLPFAVYSSFKEQRLLNVPIAKPLFIAVLSGEKELGNTSEVVCKAGEFIFLSDSSAINMRNIPKDKEYFALLIEFEYQDFEGLESISQKKLPFCLGQITPLLEKCLHQFVEWSAVSPQAFHVTRRKEILQLLHHMGHSDILSLVSNKIIGHQLHNIINGKLNEELSLTYLCEKLAMSESTLRRKLKAEGTSVQTIKDRARLGQGLHLLQTTNDAISLIAEKCGYLSPSRFTDRFKVRFGLTPSELRKTKMVD